MGKEKSRAKKGARKSAVKKGETKEVTQAFEHLTTASP
jgi:hypothetical protein